MGCKKSSETNIKYLVLEIMNISFSWVSMISRCLFQGEQLVADFWRNSFLGPKKYSFSCSSPRAAKQSWLDHSEEEEEEEEEEVVIRVKQFLDAIISSYT
jgi:hypothetical protein